MLKDTYIRIRLTKEQKEQIKEASLMQNRNMSDYVLSAIYSRLKEDYRNDEKCKNC